MKSKKKNNLTKDKKPTLQDISNPKPKNHLWEDDLHLQKQKNMILLQYTWKLINNDILNSTLRNIDKASKPSHRNVSTAHSDKVENIGWRLTLGFFFK